MPVENRPQSFAAAVVELLADSGCRLDQERRAAAVAAGRPSWDDAADALLSCYRSLLERPATASYGAQVGA